MTKHIFIVFKMFLFQGLLAGYIHREHVSTLLENEKKFSFLSNLEREMSFVTEQVSKTKAIQKQVIHNFRKDKIKAE